MSQVELADSTEDAPTRGRPRSDDRTEAILDAAREVLDELGWEAMRVQDVADRAGAGLATIYRRWSTKEELIVAAVETAPKTEYPATDDPRADLRAYVETLAAEISPKRRNFIGMLAAAQQHSAVHEVVEGHITRLRNDIATGVEAILGRPDPRAATVATAVPGMLMLRASVLDEDLDPTAFADEVLGLVDALR